MTPEAQRIAIAEACGWKPETRKMYAGCPNVEGWGKNQHLGIGDKDRDFTTMWQRLPDYLNDLNAIHEAEKTIIQGPRDDYASYLVGVVCGDIKYSFGPDGELEGNNFDTFTATAAQRAEAFLHAIHKWDDSK